MIPSSSTGLIILGILCGIILAMAPIEPRVRTAGSNAAVVLIVLGILGLLL